MKENLIFVAVSPLALVVVLCGAVCLAVIFGLLLFGEWYARRDDREYAAG